jgi:tetratricopeptide (TPR) repeat protein
MKEFVSKRAWLSASLAAMFFVAAITTAFSQENPAIKQSRLLLNNDQPSKAISVLNDAIKANPADASLLYYLGRTQLATGVSPKEVEITFQKGLDLNPKEALNTAGKGHLRNLEGNAAAAKTLFDQALSATKSKNAAVIRAVGDGYLANEKTIADAVTVLLKAKAMNDTDPHTYILLGDAYAKQAKGGEAVGSYEKAASLDPKSGYAHYKIGSVYLRSKNTAVAEEALLKAVSIDPNTTLAHKELGELYYLKKEASKAVKAYESYLALTEKKDDGKSLVAFMYFMAKDYAKSASIFEELTSKPNVSATTLKYRAYSLVESGKLDEAASAFDQYFAKAKPEEITKEVYEYVGKMYQKKSAAATDKALARADDSLAVENFKKSLAIEKDPEIASTIADMLFEKMKKYDDAAVAYEELKTIKGKLGAKETYNLGRAYYVKGDLIKADTTFGDLIAAQPNITLGYSWKAKTIARIDSAETPKFLARPYFEKVLEIATAKPESPKGDVISAYEYLGYYYDTKGDLTQAKAMFEKLKAIDPANEKAVAYLQAMKQAAQPKKKTK